MGIESFIILFILFVIRVYFLYSIRMKMIKSVGNICSDGIRHLYKTKGLAAIKEIDPADYYNGVYNHYWSFDKMILRFWIWDINKMRNR